jgi:NADPH:quinone reductase-like Zn-dependent oxidoreductase
VQPNAGEGTLQDLPETMRAVEISQPGGPEVLTLVTRPVPAPGHGEILIRVAAAGVNRPDALQRAGAYDPPPGASDLPGLEAAGTVAAVGPGVAMWRSAIASPRSPPAAPTPSS